MKDHQLFSFAGMVSKPLLMLKLTLAIWPSQADSTFGRQNATNFPTFASMMQKCHELSHFREHG
jgi:hypothetical protein